VDSESTDAVTGAVIGFGAC